jgi:tRNA-splicing endonuclease subunit Sen34
MPLDLVAYGRLATAVKKAHLLGCWDVKAEAAAYASLEWAAFG